MNISEIKLFIWQRYNDSYTKK